MSPARAEQQIIRAAATDAECIATLHGALFEAGWSTDTFALMLARDNVIGLIATADEQASPIGFAFVQVILDEAEIMTIGVAPTLQRRGIGDRLLREVLVHAETAGARAVHLEVATTNTAAAALYGRLGFQNVGLRKSYYATRDGRVDALLMRVELR